MRQLDGIASGKFRPIVGIATKSHVPFWKRAKHILACGKPSIASLGYAGVIAERPWPSAFAADGVYGIDIAEINDGDILRLEDDGSIHKLWEPGKRGNCLFMTSSCDCGCLMCPQPQDDWGPNHFREAWKILNLLKGSRPDTLCLTGGEPTLNRSGFLKIWRRIAKWFPDSQLDILTNGKAFADRDFVGEIAAIGNRNARFCVSLHGDTPALHDRISGRQGNFKATCNGIYNLWNKRQRIEIRTVITRLNYMRLRGIAEFFFNYLPFAEHYAFMGLEYHGKALENAALIGIDPAEYSVELHEAVSFLNRTGLSVSVYNVPLCMCDARDRKFARQSISDWKNFFPDNCGQCAAKGDCCGFFGTSGHLPLSDMKPLGSTF